MEAGQPFTRTSSLIETGTPSSGDSGLPFCQRFSDSRAATSERSASMRQRALIFGASRSARARTAFIVSTGEALPLW